MECGDALDHARLGAGENEVKYELALQVADDMITRLAPYCWRIQVAGSVRRHEPEVHDVELVIEPKLIAPLDFLPMFTAADDPLVSALTTPLIASLGKIKLNGDRLKKVWLSCGIYLELYVVLKPAQYGNILSIRTGPKEYSHWLVTPKAQGGAMPGYLHEQDGRLLRIDDGTALNTPNEKDFFDALGVRYLPPEERKAPEEFVRRMKRKLKDQSED